VEVRCRALGADIWSEGRLRENFTWRKLLISANIIAKCAAIAISVLTPLRAWQSYVVLSSGAAEWIRKERRLTTSLSPLASPNAKGPRPSQEVHSREALATAFADLNQNDATTHFVGQSTIYTLTGDRGTGEAYCLAHHLSVPVESDS
jgi:hypothetical protein